MEKQRILIVDMDAEFRKEIAEALPAQFTVKAFGSGTEALKYAKKNTPDIVLANMQLPGLDGIGLLERLEDAGIQANYFLVAQLFSGYMARKARDLDVCFVFVKPCAAEYIVQRIMEALEEAGQDKTSSRSYQQWVPRALTELGVPVKLKGFAYLSEAVPYLVAHPGTMITKELYPAVAARYETTGALVERSIRTAIDAAWKQRNEAVWRQYFLEDANKNIPRPTNATFISSLARHMKAQFPETGPHTPIVIDTK